MDPGSLRPNYFLFIGYLEMEGKGLEPPEPPLDPPQRLPDYFVKMIQFTPIINLAIIRSKYMFGV